jgi:hypothetical protein
LIPAFDGAFSMREWKDALWDRFYTAAPARQRAPRWKPVERYKLRHESLRVLSKRYGINQKTVAKWKKRTAVKDLPTGPKDTHSTVLGIEEEAIIVALRKHTLLPLDGSVLPSAPRWLRALPSMPCRRRSRT